MVYVDTPCFILEFVKPGFYSRFFCVYMAEILEEIGEIYVRIKRKI
jgi:hypothetical protein